MLKFTLIALFSYLLVGAGHASDGAGGDDGGDMEVAVRVVTTSQQQ